MSYCTSQHEISMHFYDKVKQELQGKVEVTPRIDVLQVLGLEGSCNSTAAKKSSLKTNSLLVTKRNDLETIN
jgi:hypothetical protein